MTAHGGMIVLGWPTVLLGQGTFGGCAVSTWSWTLSAMYIEL
jgi:hypothetical protein